MRRIPLTKKVIDSVLSDSRYKHVLAKELMLDELLCGECDPVEFLETAFRRAYVDMIKPNSIIKDEVHEKWIDEGRKLCQQQQNLNTS